MSMKRCSQGHYYDSEKHSSCPACGIPDLDIGKTKIRDPHLPGGDAGNHESSFDDSMDKTRRGGIAGNEGPTPPKPNPADEARTIGLVRKKTGIDPVVGWLVCIEGPDKGRDFRIRSEKNFIGRSPAMDICIQNDPAVSRENHGIVSFNPRKNVFKLHPGDSHGLIYLNDEDVDTPTVLESHDLIEMGETKLMFIPLCGEKFQW